VTEDLANQPAVTANGFARQWWKEAVVYQIYPRSFMDSIGDAMGTLAALSASWITSRIWALTSSG